MSQRRPSGGRLQRALVALLVALVLTPMQLASTTPTDASHATATMREEDVVRRVLAGDAVTAIVAEIERREVLFDTSDEMLGELRIAGVPTLVIEAMQRRQRELDAERTTPTESLTEDEPAGPSLRVRLSDQNEAATLTITRAVSPALEARLQLAASAEPRQIEDIAVYLACRHAEHVPDHWRSNSPLGRDFVSMPRHRMLAFVAGAEIRERRLRLVLPTRLEAELGEEPPHDVMLGVALRLDGRYLRIVDAALDELDPAAVGGELAARIEADRGGRLGSIEIRWLTPVDAVEP